NKAACALIQDANDDLVKNHLRQLPLDLLRIETHHLRDVRDFDAGEWLNYLDEILLEHRVVKAAQVVADKGVAAELVLVGSECALVLLERAVRVRACDSLHGFEVLAGILDGLL